MSIDVRKPTKKFKEILSELGTPYQQKVIDLETVIYRDLENGFDFEISGLNDNKKTFNATIFVWKVSDRKIVETIKNISSIIELKDYLGATAYRYLHNQDEA